jgi:pimeloyl-ACP methyl ester carboxylesterase
MVNKNSESNFSAYCAPQTTWATQFIKTSANISLRVITFTPSANANLPPIVLIPGLAGVIDSFKDLLVELTSTHTVYYVETREKGSAKVSSPVGFSVADIAADIPAAIQALGLADKVYVMISYSLAASGSAVLLANKMLNPELAVLVQPSASFPWPRWLLALTWVGVPLYGVIKPFVKWYMRNFTIDINEDREIYEINCRNLDQANPKRLATTVRAMARFSIWESLPKIEATCLVIGASKDSFHSHNEALSISKAIRGCKYVDLVDSRRSHSKEVALVIEKLVKDQSYYEA